MTDSRLQECIAIMEEYKSAAGSMADMVKQRDKTIETIWDTMLTLQQINHDYEEDGL